MAHKLKVKKQRLVITNDEIEESLIDEPLFVHHNTWEVIGIYPERYDLSANFDGADQTEYGTPLKGLIYKCYTVSTRTNGKRWFKYDEIPDWSLMNLDKDKQDGNRSHLINMIFGKDEYLSVITEIEFIDRLTAGIASTIPLNRVKVQFQTRTHDQHER